MASFALSGGTRFIASAIGTPSARSALSSARRSGESVFTSETFAMTRAASQRQNRDATSAMPASERVTCVTAHLQRRDTVHHRGTVAMRGAFAFAAATALLAPSALAQGAPADAGTPQAPAPVPEATLRAVKDRRVTLVTATQGEFTGKVLAVEPDSVTIVREDSEVVTIPRALLTHVRLADIDRASPETPPPPPPQRPASARAETETSLEAPPPTSPPPPPPAPSESGFAVYLNAPAGIAVDGDYGHFHAFASTAFLFPLVSSGQLFAATAGAGATFSLSPNWRIDLFGHVAPMFFPGGNYGQSFYFGVGVGFGFRYLSSNGWCIGIKLPLLGGAASSYPAYNSGVGVVAAYYYLASAVSLPVFSIGYRF